MTELAEAPGYLAIALSSELYTGAIIKKPSTVQNTIPPPKTRNKLGLFIIVILYYYIVLELNCPQNITKNLLESQPNVLHRAVFDPPQMVNSS